MKYIIDCCRKELSDSYISDIESNKDEKGNAYCPFCGYVFEKDVCYITGFISGK